MELNDAVEQYAEQIKDHATTINRLIERSVADERKRGDERVVADRKWCAEIVIAQHHAWINDRRYDASEMVSRILAEIEKGE